jgi:hypothetical protein
MRCSSCQSKNPNGSRFCIECGAVFERRCLKCEFDNLPQASSADAAAHRSLKQVPFRPVRRRGQMFGKTRMHLRNATLHRFALSWQDDGAQPGQSCASPGARHRVCPTTGHFPRLPCRARLLWSAIPPLANLPRTVIAHMKVVARKRFFYRRID